MTLQGLDREEEEELTDVDAVVDGLVEPLCVSPECLPEKCCFPVRREVFDSVCFHSSSELCSFRLDLEGYPKINQIRDGKIR
jgi:hypothetical protein